MASKEAILSADAATDARFDMAESIVDFHIRSMMCAPLVDRDGQSLGVIQIDTLDPRNRFQQDDLDVLVSVACQAAFAVENAQLHEAAMRDQALRRELAMAHEVQRGFLPSAAPRIPEYEFFEFYEPANQLGGDYYDYIELPGGRLAVVVADVSGKGISAVAVDGQALGRDALLPGQRASARPGRRAAEPSLLRQQLGRPLRDDGRRRARSAAARGDRGQRGPPAAAVAARAGGRRGGGRGGKPLAAGRRPRRGLRRMHVLRWRPANRWSSTPTASPRR